MTAPPLASRLREARWRAGISQDELARDAGLSVSCITSIEQGRVLSPRTETLQRIGKRLGLSLDELAEKAGKKESA